MSPDRHDEFTERWLDHALAHYSDSEPRAGFEGRILAGLAEKEAARATAWRRLLWIPAACAAMIVLIVMLFGPWRTKHPPTSPPAVTAKGLASGQQCPALSVVHSAGPALNAHRSRAHSRSSARAKAPEPRRETFPAAAPPSEQELLLIAYLNATPRHELLAVAADQETRREEAERKSEMLRQDPTGDADTNAPQTSPLDKGSTESVTFENVTETP